MSYDLKTIVRSIKKEYGTASVASEHKDPVDYISTGNRAVDLMLGGKGMAFGYVSEWSGLSGSGKTLMLQKMLANAQETYDAIGIWLDRENAYTNARAGELGINNEQVILAKPIDIPTVKSAEEFLKTTLTKTREKFPEAYIFVAKDSVSAFMKDQTGEDMGKKAKHLHDLFRAVLPLIDDKVSFHFTNQVTFSPGVMFGDTKTTTGGEGPKYYTTYRVALTDKNKIKDDKRGGEIVGNYIHYYVVKTRLGPSHRSITIPFYYKEGIPELGGYVRMLANRGYVKPKNVAEFNKFKQKTVIYKDKQYTEDNVEKLLADNPELLFDTWPEWGGSKLNVIHTEEQE